MESEKEERTFSSETKAYGKSRRGIPPLSLRRKKEGAQWNTRGASASTTAHDYPGKGDEENQ